MGTRVTVSCFVHFHNRMIVSSRRVRNHKSPFQLGELYRRRDKAMPFDLMAVAEGAAPKSRGLSDLRGKSLDKTLLSAFEQSPNAQLKDKAQPSALPNRLSGSFDKSTNVVASGAKQSDATTSPMRVDIKADDKVDDGLTASPRLSENPFLRSDSLKSSPSMVPTGMDKADLPSPKRLNSSFLTSQNAQEDPVNQKMSPVKRASRNSLGDNPFLQEDSAKKTALTPPWERTAVPVGEQSPGNGSPSRAKAKAETQDEEQTESKQAPEQANHEAEMVAKAEPTVEPSPETVAENVVGESLNVAPTRIDTVMESTTQASAKIDADALATTEAAESELATTTVKPAEVQIDVAGEKKAAGCCAVM